MTLEMLHLDYHLGIRGTVSLMIGEYTHHASSNVVPEKVELTRQEQRQRCFAEIYFHIQVQTFKTTKNCCVLTNRFDVGKLHACSCTKCGATRIRIVDTLQKHLALTGCLSCISVNKECYQIGSWHFYHKHPTKELMYQGQACNIKKPQILPEVLIYRLSEKEILNLIKEGSFSTTLFKLQAILELFCFMHTKGMQLRWPKYGWVT